MKFADIQHKTLGIYGLGVEGKSVYTWLKKHKCSKVFCFDEKQLGENISDMSALKDMDIVFRSPGVHPQKLLELGVEKQNISSSTQLFLDLCPTKNTIGVTGTKGKGTTSSLIFEMLKAEYKKKKQIFLGGNIGTPVFDFFDEIQKDDVVILELSSFQLYDLTISPHIAVLLRTDSEHLDWHSNVEDYRNAKKNIFLHQKKDDVLVYFDDSEIVKNMVYRKRNDKETLPQKLQPFFSRFSALQKKEFLTVGLRGDFHQENILAAIAIAKEMKVSQYNIQTVVKNFKGLPMRCQLVFEKNGRQFFNDSFSTIPQTTISALSIFKTPVFLILGGSEKHSDFSELSHYIKNYTFLKKIYLMGETSENIKKSLLQSSVSTCIQEKENLQQIFDNFKKESQKGDSLLLSPACASFDMFPNYKARGEVFNRLAQSF